MLRLLLMITLGDAVAVLASQPDFLGDNIEVVDGDVLRYRNKPGADGPDKRSAILARRSLWRNRTVPYTFNGIGEVMKGLILKSFEHYHNKTCISFREKTADDVDYLQFEGGYSPSFCASFTGRQGGKQPVYIGSWCPLGSIIHEIMHALGFNHEHTRPDRNDYISILWENIMPNARTNFMKNVGADMLGVNYDYDSIMHYPKDGFTVNGRNTIEVLVDPNTEIGQRIKFSALDIVRIDRLYDCPTSLDKGVTQWSNWASYDCAFNCAKKSRQRYCFTSSNCPINYHTGVETQYQDCTEAECNVPINGHWGMWSEKSSCYPNCGGISSINRTRRCIDPTPRNGGLDCPGEAVEYTPCRTDRCDIGEFDAEFENLGMRKWQSVGTMSWKINRGPTRTSNSGPNADHTFGDQYGGYAYAAGSSGRQNQFAVLKADNVPGGCNLTFFYHMKVDGWDQLFWVSIDDNKVFERNGPQGDAWKAGSVAIPDGSHEVKFVVKRGSSYRCDVGLDDIKLVCGNGNGGGVDSEQPAVLPSNDFEVDFGSWTNTNWQLKKGETQTWHTGPKPGDHTKGDHTGQYIYLEASNVEPGYTATLENTVTTSTGTCQMVFWYQMYGADMGSLEVHVNGIRVFNQVHSTGTMDWMSGKVTIPAGANTKVKFVAIRGSGVLSDIALDDISFENCE